MLSVADLLADEETPSQLPAPLPHPEPDEFTWPAEPEPEPVMITHRAIARSAMTTVMLPVALATLHNVMTDTRNQASARVAAARTVMDHTLSTPETADTKRDLNSLSYEEIQTMIHHLKRQMHLKALDML